MLSHSSASSTWRSWLNLFGVFFFRFFSLKKLSQLDAIELARCPWARAMCLSELDGAEPARCSWASSQKLPNVLNCQVQSPLITLVLDMVPLKKPKVTVKTYPWWNWASYMFWARSKKWKIGNSNITISPTRNYGSLLIFVDTNIFILSTKVPRKSSQITLLYIFFGLFWLTSTNLRNLTWFLSDRIPRSVAG